MTELILQLLVLFGMLFAQNVSIEQEVKQPEDPFYCFAEDAKAEPYMEYSVIAIADSQYIELPVVMAFNRQFNTLTSKYTERDESHIFDIVPVACDDSAFTSVARVITRYQRDKPIMDQMIYIPLSNGNLDVWVRSEGVIYHYMFIPLEPEIDTESQQI